MYFNLVAIVLTLGKDATAKQVGERYVINFSGASTRKYQDAQGKDKEQTSWIDVSYWVKSDKFLQYLTKGTSVIVKGSLQTRSWEDKDGGKHTATYVEAEQVNLFPKLAADKIPF